MERKKFIYNLSFVVVCGLIIRAFGLIIKVFQTRLLSVDGMSLYQLIIPTLNLVVTISSFGLQQAISKHVASNKNNRSIIIKSFSFSIIISTILSIILYLISDKLSYSLTNDDTLYYPLLSIIPLIFLISFSSIIKGYLIGNDIIDLPTFSQLFEQIIRFIILLFLIYVFDFKDKIYLVSILVLSLSIAEFLSLLLLIYKISKITNITKIKINKNKELNLILNIAFPTTISRIINSISHFLEPLIFKYSLKHYLNTKDINLMYGIINGYTFQLLTLFSFISYSISGIILPTISKAYKENNYKKIKKVINYSFFITLYFSILITILLTLYSKEFMLLIFNTKSGSYYLKYITIPFFLFYFQGILIVVLHAIDKSKYLLINSIITSIIKLSLIYLLCRIPSLNSLGYIIALIITTNISFIIDYYIVRKNINYKIKFKNILKIIIIIYIYIIFGLILNKLNIHFLLSSLFIFIINTSLFITYYFYNFKDSNKEKFFKS